MPRPPQFLRLLVLCALLATAPNIDGAGGQEPPSRALLMKLCETPRTAGTSGSLVGARFVASVLREAGWEVEIEPRVVLLSLPRRLELRVLDPALRAPLIERVERYDPDAVPPGDIPPFSAWSASGIVRAPVVDVGQGLRADYERLAADGVRVADCIALARYGGAYRGVKAELAAENRCSGLLLFSDPTEDGAERGPVWPAGPWKPDWEAQRGSILPLSASPGDPSTPGFGAPPQKESTQRLSSEEFTRVLPTIPCLPIGARDAAAILARLAARLPLEVELFVDAPRELRTIHNVIARLPGKTERLVIAGNHRDSWVRGAHDAGSGTVTLLRAAQQLGERARAGWKPENTLVLGFWDAEEQGLIGSTEWAEAHADMLRRDALVYVNADTAVGGTRFRASGSPGLLSGLRRVLEQVPAIPEEGHGPETLAAQWQRQAGEKGPELRLPGTGSDFAVFAHHLSIPVLDFSFGGASGGAYHTAFDDFAYVERFVDPGFVAHELAGRFVCELLAAWGDDANGGFEVSDASQALSQQARDLAQEDWIGAERAKRLVEALGYLEMSTNPAIWQSASVWQNNPFPELEQFRGPRFFAALRAPEGLAGRPWFENRLWATDLESGYGAETWPSLRAAAREGPDALDRELDALIAAVKELSAKWVELPQGGDREPKQQ